MKKIKIYLDNCCFNRPFDDQKQIKVHLETEAKLYIQEQILYKKLKLVWSYILDYENKFNPFDERKNTIIGWKKYSIRDVEENEQILNEAKELEELGIKSKDALHISCAVYADCDYFITTDDDLIKKLNKYKKIDILNPLKFISVMEE